MVGAVRKGAWPAVMAALLIGTLLGAAFTAPAVSVLRQREPRPRPAPRPHTGSTSPPRSVALVRRADLSIRGAGSLVVDDRHRHIFVVGNDQHEDHVEVLYPDATMAARIDGLEGATSLVLHGGSLYVGVPQGIVEIDTASLHQIRRIELAPRPMCPSLLGMVQTRLWFQFYCAPPPRQSGLGYVDVVTGRPPFLTSYPLSAACGMTSDPIDPSKLTEINYIAADFDLMVYDLSKPTPRKIRSSPEFDLIPGGCGSFVRTPDGKDLLMPNNTGLSILRVSDMSPDGTYGTSGDASWVAFSRDGTLLAAAVSSPDGNSIQVFNVGSPRPVATFRLASDVPVTQHGVAFSGDGSSLFVVASKAPEPGQVFLEIPIKAMDRDDGPQQPPTSP